MKRLLLVLSLCLLFPAAALAQGTGLWIAAPGTGRPACTSITSPVTDQSWCFDAASGAVKYWNGAAWIAISGGGGGLTGSGAIPQVAVWSGASSLTGYPVVAHTPFPDSGFVFDPAARFLAVVGTPSNSTPWSSLNATAGTVHLLAQDFSPTASASLHLGAGVMTLGSGHATGFEGTISFDPAVGVSIISNDEIPTPRPLILDGIVAFPQLTGGGTRCLHVDGSNVLSATVGDCGSGSGAPAGANMDVQFNNSGAFGADIGLFTYDSAGHVLAATQLAAIGLGTVPGRLTLYDPTNPFNFVRIQAGILSGSTTWTLPVADGPNGDCIATDGAGQLAFVNCSGGGGGMTSLNGLSAAVQSVSAGTTNIDWSSVTATHTFTWTGQLSNIRGGTGQDSSAWTGLGLVTAGTWSTYGGTTPCAGGDFINALDASGVATCATPAGAGGTATGLQASTFAGLPAPSGAWGPARLLTDNLRGLFVDVPTTGWTAANGQILNVKFFGATGDGATDDTAAIQDAAAQMTAAGAANGASVLFFPPGVYKISSEISITRDGIVQGSGEQQTYIRANAATINHFHVTGSSGRNVFRDLTLDASVTKTGGTGIVIALGGLGQDSLIDHVQLLNLYNGIDFDSSRLDIRHSAVIATNLGLYINNSDNWDNGDSSIMASLFGMGSAGTAIHLVGGGGLRIIGNKLLNGYHGIVVIPRVGNGAHDPSTATNLVDIQIIGNSIENQVFDAVQFSTPNATTLIQNGVVSNNQIAGGGLSINEIALSITGRVSSYVFANNQIQMPGTNAVGMFAENTTSDLVVTGNFVGGNGGTSQGFNIQSTSGQVSANWLTGQYDRYVGTSVVTTDLKGMVLAALPTGVANGSQFNCANCRSVSVDGLTPPYTCASGGTGATATRNNGVWKCLN